MARTNGVISASSVARRVPEPLLRTGDRLTQTEFHRRYLRTTRAFRAELIGGTVYVASPLRLPHGNYNHTLIWLTGCYCVETPGIKGGENATTILGPLSEVQPDCLLVLDADCGGQTRISADSYLHGTPEWIGEISDTSHDIDLGEKKLQYEQAGVIEYLVLSIKEKELYWFHLQSGRRIAADKNGISRSRVFPGLWIDGKALLAQNTRRLRQVLEQGLASPQHAHFVKRLAKRRQNAKS